MIFPPEYMLFVKSLIGVLAIVNPLGVIPIFLALSSDRTPVECQRIARGSAFSVAVVLMVAIWAGDMILGFFGISLSAFSCGGGLLVLLMGINMLHAKQSHVRHTPDEAEEADNKENISVVPLAIPLMAGPGAISLVIVDAHQAAGWSGRLILSVGIVIVACTVWQTLRLATPIGKKMGITGLNIATRVMGLLLVAIGVQMMTSGLAILLPGLA
ncbi:MarC family protein [Geopsychrobacter electrodiphilus]|uniref:MarC family protein n=1 Tax=Geopsychrobacter electrodiphilus TaxID=225196 RepID=UPI0003730946|nr:MarC family protein [Geopsychrobacter electrodiphilus]